MTKPRCEVCPLKEYWEKKGAFSPVFGELNTSDTIIVGDAPGKQETVYSRPFVGPAAVLAVESVEAC